MHVEYVNARDIRNEVSGGMVIAVAFVSYCISEIQNLMSTKIGVIRNFVGIKSNFCKVSYNDNSRIALHCNSNTKAVLYEFNPQNMVGKQKKNKQDSCAH